MSNEAEALQMARTSLDSAVLGINTDAHPAYVKELVTGFHGHVGNALAAGAQLAADRAELRAKADLLPPAGAERLGREAQAEAEAAAKDAMRRARQSAEALRRAAMLEAMPQIDSAREQLSRSELDMLVGTGSPAELLVRVHRIAEAGSRDAVAALLSPYGRSLLQTRGLSGSDLDGALTSAQKVVVESAEANAARHTPAELRSARLWKAVGELDGATAATSFALGHIGIHHA
jgi:hypothetical protein